VEKGNGRWGISHGAGLIAVAVALAIAVPLSAWIAVNGIKDVKQARDTIVVTGSARYPISADLGTWSLRASATGETPSTAIKALRGKVTQINAFFTEGGLSPDSITSPPIQVAQISVRVPTGVRKPAFKRVQLWRVNQNFEIQTTDIDTLVRVASQVGNLLAGGTDVSVSPISYLSTKLVAAKFAALRLAVSDAQKRASTIAEGLGARLGPLQGTRLGVYQITPRNSNEVSGGGTNDTSSRLKDVEAVVNVTFNIQH
jgi:uncharacterized protein